MEETAKGDKRRKTKMGPKMRIGLRRGKSKGRVAVEKEAEEEEEGGRRRRRKEQDMENGFTEESGWLTDDLIKRGTNYRPAGC